MNRPIAVVDTDVVILLLDTTDDPEVHRRRSYVELTIENLEKQKARFVVPTPVIAELSRDRSGSDVIREVAQKALSQLRIEVLDEDAAVVAGEIARNALQQRGPGNERGGIKYDALIAGIAHSIGARWLLTGNRRDYRKWLGTISSPVEVVVASEPGAQRQQVMLDVVKPRAKGG